jgi:hypothetical protein
MENISIYATNNGNDLTERCPIANFLSPCSAVPSSPAAPVLLNERRAIVVDSYQQYLHRSLQKVSRFGHDVCRGLTLRYHTYIEVWKDLVMKSHSRYILYYLQYLLVQTFRERGKDQLSPERSQ